MKVRIFATCPYCGHENHQWLTITSTGTLMEVFTCDFEEGGCGLPFVVSIELKPTVTIRGIDGMMEEYAEKHSTPEWSGVDTDEMIEDDDDFSDGLLNLEHP